MRRLVLLLTVMAAALVVASGLALAVNKLGTNGPDTLKGTNGDDNLLGRGGNDTLFSLGGDDTLVGGEGKDNVLGGNERRPKGGDKVLDGGSGNDGVLGGTGSDNLTGGSGNDFVYGSLGSDNIMGEEGTDVLFDGGWREASKDNLSGGPGNDWVFTFNDPAFGDVVTCGSGFDQVAADRKDVVADDCEEVAFGRAAVEELLNTLEETGFFDELPPFPEG